MVQVKNPLPYTIEGHAYLAPCAVIFQHSHLLKLSAVKRRKQ